MAGRYSTGPLYVPPPIMNIPVSNNLDLNAAYEAEKLKKRGPPIPEAVQYKERHLGTLFKTVIWATVAFVLLSHNIAYRLVNQIYSTVTGRYYELLSEDTGNPTLKGVCLHAGIFFVLMMILVF